MSAIKLVNVVYNQDVYEEMLDQVVNQMLKQSDEMYKFKDVMVSFLSKHVSVWHIQDRLADVYDKHFLPEEIDQLIEFYKTPVGQRYIAIAPKMTVDIMKVINDQIQEKSTILTEMLEQEMEELDDEE